jgi:hypothetical protein
MALSLRDLRGVGQREGSERAMNETKDSSEALLWQEHAGRLRAALEAIANSEIPGVSGGPNGPSVEVMDFAQRALEDRP